MASEEQQMLLKISQLAGQINRRKNEQPSDHQTALTSSSNTIRGQSIQSAIEANQRAAQWNKDQSQGWKPTRGAYSSRGFARGGRNAPSHRHRSLVLNGNNPPSAMTENDDPQASSASNWVAKTGRHLQLINTSIYEKDNQSRVKAFEETRKQKLKQRDDREKAKLHKHIQRLGARNTGSTGSSTAGNYEIDIQGIRFQVVKNGSKLAKVPGDLNSAKSTPKVAVVGGVRFYRTKNGNMYRYGIIKQNQKTGIVKKIDEPCKPFSTTGSCSKGPKCGYIHDPSKVAVCKDFLLKGSCPSGDTCDLSHELSPERTPHCLHFAKGKCSNSPCRYIHVRVSPPAPVCRFFGIYGYCEKGLNCGERHVHECPDFSNTGKCTTKGCKLPHRHKASIMRTSVKEEEEEDVDMSSDEDDDSIDSDDVDSDDLDEEFFGDDGATVDSDVPMQRDYLQFT